jgi:two-component system nitrogen regulation response regulator NtrX
MANNSANPKKNLDVLIVDDEEDICRLIADILKDEGYTTRYVRGSLEALKELADKQPALLLLDIWLEGSQLDGLGVLEIVREKYPDLPAIMISGHGNIETAVNSIKMGGYDFIEKPFKEERLVISVQKAIENAKLRAEHQILQSRIPSEDQFIGKSAAVNNLMQTIEKYAATKSRVFIQGPEGSGKKQFAKLIHNNSERKDAPYVVFSPAAYAPEQIELELYGKGIDAKESFGNDKPKQGIFEKAKGGTLVIDEVANLPADIQSKLLKTLANNKFKRLGAEKEYDLDVRIIATSSRDMAVEVAENRFKPDLLSRMNVVNVPMPSLKERREDIPALCEYFLKFYSKLTGKAAKRLSEEALSVLQSYEWPGNVRQLRNIVEWLTIMSPKSDSDLISVTSLANDIFSSVPSVPGNNSQIETNVDIMSMPLREARELFEKQYLLAQVNRFGGNISKTSVFIGMERSALHRKLKSLKVHDVRQNRKSSENSDIEDDSDVDNLAEAS